MNTDLSVFDKLKASITLFVSPIKGLTVKTKDENQVSIDHLKTIKTHIKAIEAASKSACEPLKAELKRIKDYENEILAPLEEAEKLIKAQQVVFADQERIEREAELKRINDERIAKEKEAQKERDRLAAEAEKIRQAEAAALKKKQEAERKAFEAAEKKKQEALKAFGVDPEKVKREAEEKKAAEQARQEEIRQASIAKQESDRLETEARLDREAKDREAAARAQEKALEDSRPKNTRQDRKWKVSDSKIVPAEFLMIDKDAVTAALKLGKEIPGIEIYWVTVAVSR